MEKEINDIRLDMSILFNEIKRLQDMINKTNETYNNNMKQLVDIINRLKNERLKNERISD